MPNETEIFINESAVIAQTDSGAEVFTVAVLFGALVENKTNEKVPEVTRGRRVYVCLFDVC